MFVSRLESQASVDEKVSKKKPVQMIQVFRDDALDDFDLLIPKDIESTNCVFVTVSIEDLLKDLGGETLENEECENCFVENK